YTEAYKQQPDLFVKLFMEDPQAMLDASMEISKDLKVLVKRIKEETDVDGIYYSVQSVQSEDADLEFHKKYVEPSDLELLEYINELWDNNMLHICGYADYTNDLDYYKQYKAKVYNWAVNTEKVSLKEGKELFGGACVLGGFDNNRETLLDIGSDEEIKSRVEEIIKEGGNKGIIIGADCTIAPEVGHKRLEAVRKFAREASK
ncbi:MAG: uroporphyrinogen decarboxylase family protein, partial [Gallicola sp.]|nr:uroporphyrinogen decarboxylase family protein [Gallicola sp.]